MHGLENVLDRLYMPNSSEELELWTAHQKFMFNVFTITLLTTKGKLALAEHKDTGDAQGVWLSLCNLYELDLAVDLQSNSLRTEIMLMKMEDSWRKGCVSFLSMWKKKILDLEDLENNVVDDSTKRKWITNTLQ